MMDVAKAREIMRNKKRRKRPAKASAVMKQRALQRWGVVQDGSRAGKTKQEVADSIGMKLTGLNTLLHRHTGSKLWPISEEVT